MPLFDLSTHHLVISCLTLNSVSGDVEEVQEVESTKNYKERNNDIVKNDITSENDIVNNNITKETNKNIKSSIFKQT